MNPQYFMSVEVQVEPIEYSYIHNGEAGISTAFEIKNKSEILLRIPRSVGTLSVSLELFADDTSSYIRGVGGEWSGLSGNYDDYRFDIPTIELGAGLYFMRPRIITHDGVLFGHRFKDKIYLDTDGKLAGLMQMTLVSQAHTEPTKIRGGVIYHIFVDRFKRGGRREVPDGSKIIPGTWRCIPEYPEYPGAPLFNNMFYGGTLWGIIEKLDYIKSLGTTAIYLSPIFRAYSNHKYDTADYMSIDPIFGGENAFKALIKACKEKGIEIILDGVFNHTGADSIYFNRYGRYQSLGAFQSKKSPYYEWYQFQDHPRKYTSWWGIEILPRINPDIPSCEEYFVGENGVIDRYAAMGIYGFRLDVADELSDTFISKIKDRLSKNRGENILYGEVWEDASNKISYGSRRKYYQGNELDAVMNYPMRQGIIDYLLGHGVDSLSYALGDITKNAPKHVLNNQMNLLGTHDTERILTVLGDDPTASGKSNSELCYSKMSAEQREKAVNRLITAYTILATVPGIPTIFYGDEAGLEGYRDPFNRMPFPWGREDMRIVSHYKKIGKIRLENDVYKSGDFKLLHLDENLLVFERIDHEKAYITVVNNSDNDIEAFFSNPTTELITDCTEMNFTISARNTNIFKTDKNSIMEID